jgi:hypothetical protein
MPKEAMAGVLALAVLWLYLSGAILTAWLAAAKGRNGVVWFFIALFVSPVLSLIALAGAPVFVDEFATYRQ